jgi:hypothetical protein
MYKTLIVVVLILSVQKLYCQTGSSIMCNENPLFKQTFFDNITIVECAVLGQKPPAELNYISGFKRALRYISKYAHVSWEVIDGYNIQYPSYKLFLDDKEKWLKWYEDHRCNNLQVDTSLLDSIPQLRNK